MLDSKRKFAILFVACILVVGFLYAILPHGFRYYSLYKNGDRYIPITQASHFDHMNVQAGRYREILDGRILSGEVDSYEHRDDPSLWPLLSAAILAPLLLFTKSVFWTFILSDFIFPILLFVGLFCLINALTKNKYWAITTAFLMMIFPQLPLLIPPSSLNEAKSLLNHFTPFPFGNFTSNLNFLTRESFIPGAPFFVGALYFIYQTIVCEKKKNFYLVMAGIFYGLTFYLYFYYWLFTSIFLGLLLIGLFTVKKKAESKSVLLVGLLATLLSIPFWINQAQVSFLPQYWELISRMGLEIGHGVRWFLWKTYGLFIVLALAAVWLNKQSKDQEKGLWHIYISALAISGILAYNASVITGFFLQSDHWSSRVFILTNGIIISTLGYYFWKFVSKKFEPIERFKKILIIISVMLIISLVVNNLSSQIAHDRKKLNNFVVAPNLMGAYEWLNDNTPTGSVVLTPSLYTNIDLSVYSHNRIFLARSQNTAASDEELLDRLYLGYKLFGVDTEYMKELINSHKGVFYFFTAKYNSRALDSSLRHYRYPLYKLPEEVADKILSEYKKYQLPPILPYRIDYVFVGPKEIEIGINDLWLNDLNVLYDKDGVKIYAWNK